MAPRLVALSGLLHAGASAPSAMLPDMSVARPIVLSIRFLFELAVLGGLAWAATGLYEGVVAVAAAVGWPVAAASVWGHWVAPRARRRLPDPLRIIVELAIFAAAAAALAAAGHTGAAIVIGGVSAAAAVATRIVGEPEPPPR